MTSDIKTCHLYDKYYVNHTKFLTFRNTGLFLAIKLKCQENMNFPSCKQMKNMMNLLTATNSYLFVDCLYILKDNMGSYFQYLLLVQSSEEARKEKEEKKRYLIRKVIYIIFLCLNLQEINHFFKINFYT